MAIEEFGAGDLLPALEAVMTPGVDAAIVREAIPPTVPLENEIAPNPLLGQLMANPRDPNLYNLTSQLPIRELNRRAQELWNKSGYSAYAIGHLAFRGQVPPNLPPRRTQPPTIAALATGTLCLRGLYPFECARRNLPSSLRMNEGKAAYEAYVQYRTTARSPKPSARRYGALLAGDLALFPSHPADCWKQALGWETRLTRVCELHWPATLG